MELTRKHFRAMIYYDFRRGLSRQECIDQLISSFGDEALTHATVKRWYNEFDRSNACKSVLILKENTLKNNKPIFDDKLLLFIIRLKI